MPRIDAAAARRDVLRGALARGHMSSAIAGVVSLSFAAYAVLTLWRQSFIAIDGQRYFNFADDGLITLRYGWNLAHGNGLVWNPGERLEGITNPGWALYSAAMALFLDRRVLPFAMQLSGVATLLATAIACRRIYRKLATSRSAAAQHVFETIALLVPLCYVPLINWTLGGMETGPVAALVATAISVMIGTSSSLAGSLLLGVAFSVRPDVAVPAIVVLGMRWCRHRPDRPSAWSRSAELVAFFSVALAVTIARYLYYGALVPNTYVLKVTGTPMLERIQGNGLLYVRSWLSDSKALVALLILGLILRPKWDKLLLAAVLASMLAYCLYAGGDAFTQWRFLAPYVPLAVLVVLTDVASLGAWAVARASNHRLARVVEPAICLAAGCLFLLHVWTQSFKVRQEPGADNIANVNTAIFLSRLLGPQASVGVFYAGAIPFYTGLRAVDFLGKGDPYIARLPPDRSGAFSVRGMRNVPGHDKYDLAYSILAKRPTFVAGFAWGRQDLSRAASGYYVRVPVGFATWPDGSDRAVLLLRDSPDVDWPRVRSLQAAR